jgi:hypothetical protein
MNRAFVFILLFIVVAACNRNEESSSVNAVPLGTIIYDTQIVNPNPENEWVTESLSGLEREKLIEIIFNGVYSGKLIPLDYFSKEKLSIEDIRLLEESEEFSRDRIAQIKFDEKWAWEPDNSTLKKHVKAITIAYEVYDNLGEVRGYKPAFKIVF